MRDGIPVADTGGFDVSFAVGVVVGCFKVCVVGFPVLLTLTGKDGTLLE